MNIRISTFTLWKTKFRWHDCINVNILFKIIHYRHIRFRIIQTIIWYWKKYAWF